MLKRFLGDCSGNFAMMMVIMTLPLLLAIGFGVDYARYVSARQHLQEVTDAASLAVAASTERNDGKLRALAADMISVNTSGNRIQNVSVSALDIDDDQVDLSLGGNIPTFFMGLVNINRLDVATSALAIRAVTGSVEVALVLDNTESMLDFNKIGTLRTAARDLVSKLFSDENANVRIGLVPYADNINVGVGNRNASWLSIPADYVTQPAPKTCKDVQVTRTPCLKSEDYPCITYIDGVPKDRTCSRCVQQGTPVTTTENQCTGGGNPVTNSWKGCIGSRVASNSTLVLDDQSPSVPYPGFLDSNDNKSCLSPITPLSGSRNTVLGAVDGMTTTSKGYKSNTYIPAGMIWGLNILSPSAPFTEGAAYDAENTTPRKVIVLMTDGLNSRAVTKTGGNKGKYQDALTAASQAPVNADTKAVCAYAKAKKIEIYSVAFMVTDVEAKTMLQGCATDASHYFDASDSTKMLEAFSKIARSLTQVRLAR